MDSDSLNHTISRKEREKLARQKEILDAARELFLKKGFHATTLDEIARQADYGKGTIYNYFEGKEDLFRSIINQFTDEIGDLVREAIAQPAGLREKLKVYAKVIIQYSNKNSDLFHFIAQEIHRSELPEYEAALSHLRGKMVEMNKQVSRYIEQEIALGKTRPLDPMMLVNLFDGMVHSYCMMHSDAKRELTENEIDTAVDAIVSVFFDGIAATNTKG